VSRDAGDADSDEGEQSAGWGVHHVAKSTRASTLAM
jgi:hypothetical protein